MKMRTALYTAALMGTALVSAMPSQQQDDQSKYTDSMSSNSNGKTNNDGSDNGKFDDNTQPFPLQDGFPNPSSQQLLDIERNAHGTLSNATGNPNAPPLSEDTIISLQLIATTELLESDYFENFLLNVTEKKPGFDKFDSDEDFQFLVDTLTQIVGIEELHAINANNALMGQGKDPIKASKYQFPVTNLDEAFAVANALTDGVLSTLQDVVRRLADDNDHGLINGVVSIVGDEGEQDGYFRSQQGRTPAAQPFLTGGDRRFAFSILEQSFIVPGTDSNDIDLPVFLPLSVDTQNIDPEDQTLKFSITLGAPVGNSPSGQVQTDNKKSSSHRRRGHVRRQDSGASASSSPSSTASSMPLSTGNSDIVIGGSAGKGISEDNQHKSSYNSAAYTKDYDWSSTSIVYISEQNVPIVEKIQNVQFEGNKITFEAFFPGKTNFLDAFTIAAVTDSAGPFSSPVDVANHTIAGPGFIEATD